MVRVLFANPGASRKKKTRVLGAETGEWPTKAIDKPVQKVHKMKRQRQTVESNRYAQSSQASHSQYLTCMHLQANFSN